MSWNGYFTFGGNEIINVDRVETYCTKAGLTAFKPTYKNGNVARTVGDRPYSLPQFDSDVPWYDDQEPDSFDFFGLYPLDVTGIEDSTRSTNLTEYTGDGGSPGRIRHGMRTLVFDCLLLAADDGGADYGMSWLKSVLLAGQGGDCVGTGFDGTQLCFFNQEPWGTDSDQAALDCGSKLMRYMYRAVITSGPTVSAKKDMRSGVAWNVQFTMTIGNPWKFGTGSRVLDEWMLPNNDSPAVGGGYVNTSGYTWVNVNCPGRSYRPVFDPNCPDLILPPATPDVPLGCIDLPSSWKRRFFTVPRTFSRTWTDAVPVFTLTTRPGLPVRNLRLRFYADPENAHNTDIDSCDYCADILFTYIPDNGVLTFDGRHETVTFKTAGQSRRADSLVMTSDGMPVQWPQLSCGVQYAATLDSLQTQKMPSMTLSIVPKVR